MNYKSVYPNLACCLSAECYVCVLGSSYKEEKDGEIFNQKDKWNHWNDEKIRQR